RDNHPVAQRGTPPESGGELARGTFIILKLPMLRSLLLYLSEREGPKQLLTDNTLGRRLASRFIAGEKVEDALRVIRRLNAEGFQVTLDCLGESVREIPAADAACHAYLELL